MTPFQKKIKNKYPNLLWKYDDEVLFLSRTVLMMDAYITIDYRFNYIDYYEAGCYYSTKEISKDEIEKYHKLETKLANFK